MTRAMLRGLVAEEREVDGPPSGCGGADTQIPTCGGLRHPQPWILNFGVLKRPRILVCAVCETMGALFIII